MLRILLVAGSLSVATPAGPQMAVAQASFFDHLRNQAQAEESGDRLQGDYVKAIALRILDIEKSLLGKKNDYALQVLRFAKREQGGLTASLNKTAAFARGRAEACHAKSTTKDQEASYHHNKAKDLQKKWNEGDEVIKGYLLRMQTAKDAIKGLKPKRDFNYKNYKRLYDKVEAANSKPQEFWRSFDVVFNNDASDANNYLRIYKGLKIQIDDLIAEHNSVASSYDEWVRYINSINVQLNDHRQKQQYSESWQSRFKSRAGRFENTAKQFAEQAEAARDAVGSEFDVITQLVNNNVQYKEIQNILYSAALALADLEEKRKKSHQVLQGERCNVVFINEGN